MEIEKENIQATNSFYIELEDKHGARNYKPLPVVLCEGSGVKVTDVEGKSYFDFVSSYSAVNPGHCHPKLVSVMTQQAPLLTLTSRAFHTQALAEYVKFITEYFGYDRVLAMNTGVEAGESGCKLARKWAYLKKGVPENQAVIAFAEGGFWGRTIAAVSASTDVECYKDFGPYVPGFKTIPYDDLEALKTLFESEPNMAAFYVEPLQGEAGVRVPKPGYLKGVHDLCKKHNVLWISDEIQTGLGRTGTLLASDCDGVRPDILLLGKALSGGVYPVSAILASHEVMLCIRPNEHGSTYGGNPLGCKVAMAALTIVKEEGLCENAMKLGEIFRSKMQQEKLKYGWVVDVRGRGLMNAIEVQASSTPGDKKGAWDFCILLMQNGLLAKPTHSNIIRFLPPLVLTEEQMNESIQIISKCLAMFNERFV